MGLGDTKPEQAEGRLTEYVTGYRDGDLDNDKRECIRKNVFDDDLAIIDTFSVPADIKDLTIALNGNIMAAIGSGLTELAVHHDYFITDNQRGIVYYREKYGYVEVSGVRDA